MNTYRKNATIVGILYILGTVFGILSVVFTQPVANAQDHFAVVMSNENRVIIGAIFILMMGLVLAMVPVVLFPILKKVNEVLALGYVVFRGALETATYMGSTACWLLLVPFAQGYAETSNVSTFQNLAVSLQQVGGGIDIIRIFVFGLGALMLYSMLYTSNLVPRWISVWGFIAVLLDFASAFLGVFGLMDASMGGGTFFLSFPLFLQEMVMAVWLIVKGFDSTAITAGSS